MKKKNVKVSIGQTGDARPVAMLVQVASQFDSSIHIESGEKYVNAKSIMGMMTLALDNGMELSVVADGSDEAAAIESIEKYLSGGN